MKWIQIAALPLLLCLGCGFAQFNDDRGDDHKPDIKKPEVIKTTPADVWDALAKSVAEASIDTPRELSRYVKILCDNGELSDQDHDRFDAEFDNARSDESKLDPNEDAKRVRRLGKPAVEDDEEEPKPKRRKRQTED